jgi:hypothetical protein
MHISSNFIIYSIAMSTADILSRHYIDYYQDISIPLTDKPRCKQGDSLPESLSSVLPYDTQNNAGLVG